MIRPLASALLERMHAHPLFRRHGRTAVILGPFAFLLVFFLLPFLVILRISFADMLEVGYGPLLTVQDGVVRISLDLNHYLRLVGDALYSTAYVQSLEWAALTTLCCLVIGYPFAYFMARARAVLQPALLMLVMLPFWTSFLLRVYAWKGLLTEGGWVHGALVSVGADRLLLWAGLIDTPGKLMNTPFALLVGMVYTYLPFMILPLYSTLSKLDGRLLEASADLGGTPWVTFWTVTVPLSRAGIIAGSMLVFIPCIGEYVIPEMLGGPKVLMIGRVLYDEFFSSYDWPMASAVAVVLILVIVVPLALFNRYQAQATEARS
jgi:putrescine transport system permease protein